jgi:hypothetical protein
VAVDQRDFLHVVLGFSPGPGHDLFYYQAPAAEGLRLGNWTAATRINGNWNTYMSSIATHEDSVYVVYDDVGLGAEDCATCADIFFRRSTDRGRTWSEPVDLLPTAGGSSRAQLEVDRSGTVYVAWDEGWDRYTGRGKPSEGVFMSSGDGGSTWSDPLRISYPANENAQLAVGASGTGRVVLVWRTTSDKYPGIYYMTSTDWGTTWAAPATIPDIIARPWTNPYDVYDLAADSAGDIHLIVDGFRSTGGERLPRYGVYHLVWDGSAWSSPMSVYEGEGYPEYPHIVIDVVDDVHATWFVRAAPWGEELPHTVWYAHGVSRRPDTDRRPPPARLASHSYVPPTAVIRYKQRPNESTTTPWVRWTDLAVLLGSMVTGGMLVAAVQVWLNLWQRWKRRSDSGA